MTAHDNYLLRDADGPDPMDEEAMQESINYVADELVEREEVAELIQTIYDAGPSINHALREIIFPTHLRAQIVALANMAADIRAKVDDDYKVRTTTFDDPRD